ncbi:MAG: SUMF1/EgtB/PvdO family nonheme iron enzyme [Sedimentisphaerales bacterium]|nr:SUMF1/EgtB/PvdO family nonheme iron enzyme [Sedimentisphaerales bacterium]
MNDAAPATSALDAKSQQNLEKVIRNAPRTCALVGFPNSGKTAYLTAMGKVLEGPQSNGLWRIVGSSKDIFMHVNELLSYEDKRRQFEQQQFRTEEDLAEWRATEVHLAPKPLNLFNARRKGLLYRKTSAFDTSGEQYLAITQTQADASALTPTEFYAEILREKVLPKCPGMLVLVDCDLPPAKLSEQVNRYHVLFDRIHGFGFGEKEKDQGKDRPRQSTRKIRKQLPFNQPIPIAFAITKVDLLEDRQITLHPEDCAFLQYLKKNQQDPSHHGIRISNNGQIASYNIRTEVFLDQKRFPEEAAQAVLHDFIQQHMSDLANLMLNMKMSEMYQVKTFAISAWGKPLQRGADGVEVRPSTEEIEPARVLTPQFWLLEQIHRNWSRNLLTKAFGWLCTIMIILLLLGPGLYWSTMKCASYNIEKYQQDQFQNESALDAAYYCLALNNNSPFTRFVQPLWEPQAQQRLVDQNITVIEALLERDGENDREHAASLINQAAKLGIAIPNIGNYHAAVLRQDFLDALEQGDLERIFVTDPADPQGDSIAQRWLTIQSRRQPATYFNQTVALLAQPLASPRFSDSRKLPAHQAFLQIIDSFDDRQLNLEAADALPTPPAILDLPARNAYYYSLAQNLLQQGRNLIPTGTFEDIYDVQNDPCVIALINARQILANADLAARRSADRSLMQRCYEASWQVNQQLFQIYVNDAINRNVENNQFDQLRENWYQALQVFQRCPGLKRQLEQAARRLVYSLRHNARSNMRLISNSSDNCQIQVANAINAIDQAIRIHLLLDYTYEVAELQTLAAIYRFQSINCMNAQTQDSIHQILQQAKSIWAEAELTLLQSDRGREIYQQSYDELTDIAVRLYESGRVNIRDLDPPVEMRGIIIRSIDNLIEQHNYDSPQGAIAQLRRELQRSPDITDQHRLRLRSQFVRLLQVVTQSFAQPNLDPDLAQQRLQQLAQCAAILGPNDLTPAVNQLDQHLAVIRDMALVTHPEHSFYIDPTEVVVNNYQRFLAELPNQVPVPYYNVLQPNGSNAAVRLGDPEFGDYSAANIGNSPIVGVSYNDALAFAQHYHKRLPTLREYQLLVQNIPGDLDRFARLGQNGAEENAPANVNLRQTGITPVDRHFQDEFGQILGIAGNVREWCVDAGQIPALFGMSYFRAGAADWHLNAENRDPEYRDRYSGFRCAADVLPQDFHMPAVQPTTTTTP